MKTTYMVIAFTISLISFGQTTWIRAYGGLDVDQGVVVRSTSDNGCIVAGTTGSFGVGGDGYVLRLDMAGDVMWSSIIGGQGVEKIWDIAIGTDGLYVVGVTSSVGSGGYDGFLAKLDGAGTLLWQREYGSSDWEMIHSIAVDDTGLYMAGKTYSGTLGDADCWLLRADLNGEVVWQRTAGGPWEDEAFTVKAISDGGCLVAGTRGQDLGMSDAYILRYGASGDLVWDETAGTDSVDVGYGLALTQDGNFVIGGSTNGFSSASELMLVKFNMSGDQQWFSHIGQISDFVGRSIAERVDQGLVMTGYTTAFGLGGKDVYLLKASATGDFEFGATFGGTNEEEGLGLALTADGGFLVAGYAKSFGPGAEAVYVIRTDTDANTASDDVEVLLDPVGVGEVRSPVSVMVFPNPTHVENGLTVSLGQAGAVPWQLCDLQGRVIVAGTHLGVNGHISLNGQHAGHYLLHLFRADGSRSILPVVITE